MTGISFSLIFGALVPVSSRNPISSPSTTGCPLVLIKSVCGSITRPHSCRHMRSPIVISRCRGFPGMRSDRALTPIRIAEVGTTPGECPELAVALFTSDIFFAWLGMTSGSLRVSSAGEGEGGRRREGKGEEILRERGEQEGETAIRTGLTLTAGVGLLPSIRGANPPQTLDAQSYYSQAPVRMCAH